MYPAHADTDLVELVIPCLNEEAALPALLGAPIDHVMTTKQWTVTGMRVIQTLDDAGSDHRPIVVQLSAVVHSSAEGGQ